MHQQETYDITEPSQHIMQFKFTHTTTHILANHDKLHQGAFSKGKVITINKYKTKVKYYNHQLYKAYRSSTARVHYVGLSMSNSVLFLHHHHKQA